MALKYYNPLTPGRRLASADACLDVTTNTPYKPLLVVRKVHAGRNNLGRVTVRHQGGGHKRFVRLVDFKMDKYDIPATVQTIEYDPNRNGRIALVKYQDGERRYVLAPDTLKVGDVIVSSKKKVEVKVGNRATLENIPTGVPVCNIELEPGTGGKLVRGAGLMASLLAIEGEYAHLRMPSGEVRLVRKECMATIGVVSNADHRNIRIGKAGRSRHMGIRPAVRGKAMNPVDHPHGGGNGKNPIGLTGPKTREGRPARGVKTRDPKRKSSSLILKKRK